SFFFSSRRRHTRSKRDWSSDVCSSDLTCQFFHREATHDKLTLHYFVWLILGGPKPILVDTGFKEDDARARGIRNYVSPATVVERVGVKAYEIPTALITHLHYDHWAGHSLFPGAEFW